MSPQLTQFFRKNFKIGPSIFWWKYENRRICGHSGSPQKGDIITSKMESGKIGVFEVTEVEWCGDPRNMYFADVKDVGYWDTTSGETETRG